MGTIVAVSAGPDATDVDEAWPSVLDVAAIASRDVLAESGASAAASSELAVLVGEGGITVVSGVVDGDESLDVSSGSLEPSRTASVSHCSFATERAFFAGDHGWVAKLGLANGAKPPGPTVPAAGAIVRIFVRRYRWVKS